MNQIVFLGTPHHGAPLERAGNWIDILLGATPYAAPFARLGKVRSAGITDLRHGNLLDEDWGGRDRFARGADRRVPVPLPDGMRCYAVATTAGEVPGYLWIFPLPDGRANVGLGLRTDMVKKRRVDLKKLLNELITEHPQLRERFANAKAEGPVQGMGLPLASKRWPISGDGFMLIGDAAHLIDPFTGEGISHAMISGVHAANVAAEALQAIREEQAVPQAALKDYDAHVWKRLGKELGISTRLQQLADRPWLFNLVVNKAASNPVLADTISCMFNDLDMRERLKKPGFYLKLLFG